MIDIEQRGLSAFKKHLLLGLSGVSKEVRRLADERTKSFDKRCDLGKDLIGTQRLVAEECDDTVGFL